MQSTESFIAAIEERLHNRALISAHHERGIIAINKGAGLLSHPNPVEESDSPFASKRSSASQLAKQRGLVKEKPKEVLRSGNRPACLDAPYDWAEEAYLLEGSKLYLCNRLDSATSGILIACCDRELALAIKEHWVQREVTKIYISILRGQVSRSFEKWIDSLEKEPRPRERGVRMNARMGAAKSRQREAAKTSLRRIHYTKTEPKVTLVAMQPITGRTHQLRVQSQLHHYPIVGDAKYGDFRFNRALDEKIDGVKGRMFLHSYFTKLGFEFGGEKIEFEATAPVPDSFWSVIKTDLSESVSRAVDSMLNM